MTARKKLIFAINCVNIGGAPTVVYNQIRLLDKEKFEIHLLLLYKSKPANYLNKIEGIIGGENIYHFHYNRSSKFDFKTVYQIYKLLCSKNFDVVFTHLFLANFVVRFAAVCAGIQNIITFEHSMYTDKRFWQIIVDRILAKKTKKVVVSTEEVKEFTISQQKLPPDKCVVIRNPISIPERSEAEVKNLQKNLGLDGSELVFLTIGRFSKVKGHRVIVDAVLKLTETSRKILFLFVGHGPEEQSLIKYIVQQKAEDKIKLVHDPVDATRYLHIAGCFILPSFREGQAMAAEEAIRTGVPVIASKLPGMGGLVKDSVNGFTFPVGDAVALSGILKKIINAPDILQPLALGALSTAAQLPSNDSIISELENILWIP